MGMEKWIAAAGMGLFALFAGEMASIYNYMQTAPEDMDAGIIFEPNPKILQFISIGAAPGSIMAAVSFLLSRRYGSRHSGTMIIAGGAAMLVGMLYCQSVADSIHAAYATDATDLVPPLFITVSVPVMAAGALLFRTRKRRRRKDYL